MATLKTSRFEIFAALIFCGMACTQTASAQEAAEKITYDDHVKPVFVSRCSSCHNGQKREGDLDVTNYTNLMQGGGSGTVIEPLESSSSFLYQLITHEESPEMPPSGTKIPDPEIQLIAKWIDLGALENKGSKAAKAKPKFDMAMSENPTVRPEIIPMPLRIPLEPVIQPDRPSVLAIATSPWAPIAAVSAPKQILLYNTQTLELSGVLPMEEGVAHSLKFSRSGQLLLAGGGRDGASGKTILFNVLTGERLTTVGDELEAILASDISPNHELIAFGGPTKLVKILAIADGSVIAEINKHTEWVTALEFSPDGKFLATGDRNGGLQVWEAETGNEVFTLKGHSAAISGVSWRADSQILCSASEDTTIRLWEMKNGGQIKSWGGHGGGVTAVEFQRDGQIVSAGRDKVAKLWDQAGTMVKQFPGMPDVAVAVSYCDETKRVLAGDWSGKLSIWNAADAVHVGDLATNPPTLAQRLAASQAALAAANQKQAPLEQQLTATKTAMDTMGKSLEVAKQKQTELQTKITTTQQQFDAAKQQFDATLGQLTQMQTEMTEKTTAQPLIKESLDKAVAASQALPSDAELKTAVTTMDAKLKQIDARVTELTTQITAKDGENKAAKTQMDQMTQVLTAAKTEMDTVTAEVTKLAAEYGALGEKMKTESQAVAAAVAEVQKATQMVERWNSNIQFISELSALDQQLQATESDIEAKQTVVDAAHQKLLEAQKAVDDAAQQKADAEKKADELKQQIMALRGA